MLILRRIMLSIMLMMLTTRSALRAALAAFIPSGHAADPFSSYPGTLARASWVEFCPGAPPGLLASLVEASLCVSHASFIFVSHTSLTRGLADSNKGP